MNLTILNLKETLFHGEVQSMTIPAAQGELTILPNHVPIITPLKKGVISASTVKSERYAAEEKKYIECQNGILEFSNNEATILL